jgi:hypothetical protein
MSIQDEVRKLRLKYIELREKNPAEAAKIAEKIHKLNEKLAENGK